MDPITYVDSFCFWMMVLAHTRITKNCTCLALDNILRIYFSGLIKFVLKNLFQVPENGIQVVVEPQQIDGYIFQTNFRLQFDNSSFYENSFEDEAVERELDEIIPVTSLSILNLFPFFIYFDR